MTDDRSDQWFVGLIVCIAVLLVGSVVGVVIEYTWEVGVVLLTLSGFVVVPYVVGWVTVRVTGIEVNTGP